MPILSGATPAACASAASRAITSRALESHGSLASSGAKKRCGYHVPPCAAGARKARPEPGNASASPAMSCGDLKVLDAVEAANDAQKHVLAAKVKVRFGADLAGRRFALWGLAFKPRSEEHTS